MPGSAISILRAAYLPKRKRGHTHRHTDRQTDGHTNNGGLKLGYTLVIIKPVSSFVLS